MQYKIIHKQYYFERELFLLEIDNKFTMVYRGSGLNGGKIGRVLPFAGLKDTQPRLGDIRLGHIPGYIYKEFYYNHKWIFHGKNMNQFPNTLEFIEYLEETLPVISDYVEQDFNNALEYAKEFMSVANKLTKNMENFDWNTVGG